MLPAKDMTVVLRTNDDWELNGDIIVYYPVLDIGLELSSMGIRVDEDSLKAQLKEAGCEDRAELPFQKALLNGELPYTVRRRYPDSPVSVCIT